MERLLGRKEEPNEPEYLQVMRDNKSILRGILVDLKSRIDFFPNEPTIDEVLENLLTKQRASLSSKFRITDFRKGPWQRGLLELTEHDILIGCEDLAPLSGSGAMLIYEFEKDDSVEYKQTISIWKG